MHLMFRPFDAAVDCFTREKMGVVLDFMYLRWYGDPFRGDPAYQAYMRELVGRVKRGLPKSISWSRPGYHSYPGALPLKELALTQGVAVMIGAIGTTYKVGPFRTLLESRLDAAIARFGVAPLLAGFFAAVAAVNWWLIRYRRRYEK